MSLCIANVQESEMKVARNGRRKDNKSLQHPEGLLTAFPGLFQTIYGRHLPCWWRRSCGKMVPVMFILDLQHTLFVFRTMFEHFRQIFEDLRKNKNFEKFQISQKFLDAEKTSKNFKLTTESMIWGWDLEKIFDGSK